MKAKYLVTICSVLVVQFAALSAQAIKPSTICENISNTNVDNDHPNLTQIGDDCEAFVTDGYFKPAAVDLCAKIQGQRASDVIQKNAYFCLKAIKNKTFTDAQLSDCSGKLEQNSDSAQAEAVACLAKNITPAVEPPRPNERSSSPNDFAMGSCPDDKDCWTAVINTLHNTYHCNATRTAGVADIAPSMNISGKKLFALRSTDCQLMSSFPPAKDCPSGTLPRDLGANMKICVSQPAPSGAQPTRPVQSDAN